MEQVVPGITVEEEEEVQELLPMEIQEHKVV
jgi:hypothetical protein